MAENAGSAGGLKDWAGWAAAKNGSAKTPKPAGVHPAGPKKKAGPPAPGTKGDGEGADDKEPVEGGDENDLALDTIEEQLETLSKKFTDGKGAQLINEMKSKLNELRDEHESSQDDEDDEGDEPGEGDDDESPDADDAE